MHMLDWNAYRAQVSEGAAALGRLSPETVRGYAAISAAAGKTGLLDGRTRELIALAVAVSLRCDGCIAVHTEAARRLGASEGELAEALSVAIGVNAGAAMVYSLRTMDAYRAATNASDEMKLAAEGGSCPDSAVG